MLSVILPYKARTFLIHGLSALCTRLLGLLGFLLYTLRPGSVKRSASAPILRCRARQAASRRRQVVLLHRATKRKPVASADFSVAPCQDCTQALTGVGSPAPEQKSKQRMMPETGTTAQALGVDIGGRSVTIEGVMFFSENHRQACLPKGMIK